MGLLYVKSPAALQGEEGRPGGLWAVPRHTAADIGALSLPQTAPASPGSPAAVPERIRILHTAPRNAVALATPGLDYVQQAKSTADPTYYPKAEGVLKRSLASQKKNNSTAMDGIAALEAGRHRFTDALGWAKQSVTVNPYSSPLYGMLADAYTQLGRYWEAADATQRVVGLKPGAPSLSRASYVAELRGDVATARIDTRPGPERLRGPGGPGVRRLLPRRTRLQQRRPRHRAEGSRRGGSAGRALLHLPVQAKAGAEAALGRTGAAIADLNRTVQRVFQPEYILQLGQLYQSLGRTKQADFAGC
ncbi:tetratricopeptide repeat protein [Streptomyces sp. NPDC090052]|uniref:tetratricopeptide repeat protein n=1 Tax=Streptomyces sp. NPDC090052 TaxID=3365931 RepID=UPI0037FA362D